jgi:hypothetical protein
VRKRRRTLTIRIVDVVVVVVAGVVVGWGADVGGIDVSATVVKFRVVVVIALLGWRRAEGVVLVGVRGRGRRRVALLAGGSRTRSHSSSMFGFSFQSGVLFP